MTDTALNINIQEDSKLQEDQASSMGGSTQLRPASPHPVKAGAPTQSPIVGVGVKQGYAAPAWHGSTARLVLQDPGSSPGVPPGLLATTKAPPGAPPPPPTPHHPSPSPPYPGQPPAPRTEDKSSVSSGATAGLPEKVPVDEPPSPKSPTVAPSLTPGPLAPTVSPSLTPGPLAPTVAPSLTPWPLAPTVAPSLTPGPLAPTVAPSLTPGPLAPTVSPSLTPGPLAPTVKVDQSSLGPPLPPTTVEDKSSRGTQGASGFTAGDTSFVPPVVNPQVPLSHPRTL